MHLGNRIKLFLFLALTALIPSCARANGTIQGWCEDGAQLVITSGLQSTTQVQASYPSCTVTVNLHGGGPATIYSDNTGTVLSNPFTATSNGQFEFYATQGRYDVLLSGAGFPSPVLYSDIIMFDPVQFAGVQCALPFSASPNFTANTCSLFSMTLTGNVVASNISGAIPGQSVTFSICQDATGSHAFTWPASFFNPPILNPLASSCEQLSFVLLADGLWHSTASGETQVFNGGSFNGVIHGNFSLVGNVTATAGQNSWEMYNLDNVQWIECNYYPCSDIGLSINQAYVNLPAGGGTIIVPASTTCYQQTTAIVFGVSGKNVLLEGSPGSAACIQWTSATGTAITFNTGPTLGTTHPRGYGMRDIELEGPTAISAPATCTTGITAIGVFLGGSNGAEGQTISGSNINCFGTDVNFGNNTWATLIDNSVLRNATTVLNFPNTTSNSGELLKVNNSTLINDVAAVVPCAVNIQANTGIDITFDNDSFDGLQFCAIGGLVTINQGHFENPGIDHIGAPPLVANNGLLRVNNTTFFQDASGSCPWTPCDFMEQLGGNPVVVSAPITASNAVMTGFILYNGTASVEILSGGVTSVLPFNGWLDPASTSAGYCLIDRGRLLAQPGDFISCGRPVIYEGGLNVPAPSSVTFGSTLDVPEFTGGEVGWRNIGTPDTIGGYTSKIYNARCVAPGLVHYNSELDFYTETKTATNFTDTSTVTGVADCYGNWEGNAFANRTLPNDGTTGTATYATTSLLAGKAITTTGGATSGVIGITIGTTGASGILGNSITVLSGPAACVLDNSPTLNGWLQISSVGGQCHNVGTTFPAGGGEVLGQILSTTPVTTNVYPVNVDLQPAAVASSCGTTTTCASTSQPGAHIFYGTVPLTSASPSTATVTGLAPAYTSTSTFNCTVTNTTNTANSALKVTNVSTSSFTITGPNTITDVISYSCIGT